MPGKDGGSLQVVPEGLQPPGLRGSPRGCCELGVLSTSHAALYELTKRNELYSREAGCVQDMTRWWFRVAVVVPDHAANNFIVLVVPRGQAFLPFRRSHLFHPFHLIDILSG